MVNCVRTLCRGCSRSRPVEASDRCQRGIPLGLGVVAGAAHGTGIMKQMNKYRVFQESVRLSDTPSEDEDESDDRR